MVFLLSHNDAHTITVTLPDGRKWGPFDNVNAAACWEEAFASNPLRLATAREIFEGSVEGDGYHLVSPLNLEMGIHPFVEINDWYIEADNGNVVADLANGIASLSSNHVVYVDNPLRNQHPMRELDSPKSPPEKIDLDHKIPAFTAPCRKRGEILVVQADDHCFVVAWREDQRVFKSLPVLSLHTIKDCAINRAKREARWHNPPERLKSLRKRDYQRGKVYSWEHSFASENMTFGSIDECRDYANEICGILGLKTPAVNLGRHDLENHSYFNAVKGIVLEKTMMTSHTVIHELAHYAVYLGRTREPSHGPYFAGTLAGMLCAFSSADLDEAISKAEEMGVDIDRVRAEELAELRQDVGASPS